MVSTMGITTVLNVENFFYRQISQKRMQAKFMKFDFSVEVLLFDSSVFPKILTLTISEPFGHTIAENNSLAVKNLCSIAIMKTLMN